MAAWIDWTQVRPFLAKVDLVLNSRTYLVECDPAPQPVTPSNIDEAVWNAVTAPWFGDALDLAVERADPGEVWDTPYAPPTQRAHAGAMSLKQARRRLEAMLTAAPPFMSPYGHAIQPEQATEAVASFLSAFDPAPTCFAEVEPQFLAGWGYLDGFCDGALAIAADTRLALLVNNGTD